MERLVLAMGAVDLSVLGVSVEASLVERWLEYWAPEIRPFPLKALPPGYSCSRFVDVHLAYPAEWRDTFYLYSPGPWAWLSRNEYEALPSEVQRRLALEGKVRCRRNPATGWSDEPLCVASMIRWIEAGVRSSLHPLARTALVAARSSVLPRAVELAGSFPARSGPNCFGTVMAAAGEDTAEEWMQVAPFVNWLDSKATPVVGTARDAEAGTILVWHENGQLAHAAVTVGGGFVLHKASQSWSSPVSVIPVSELVHSWTYPGTALTRFALRAL